MDTNACSVPWRLIGERVRVLVTRLRRRPPPMPPAACRLPPAACHRRSAGRRGRVIDNARFAGVAGAASRVRTPIDEIDAPVAISALPRPLAEYEAVAGGAW
jgi:hypothetical protein